MKVTSNHKLRSQLEIYIRFKHEIKLKLMNTYIYIEFIRCFHEFSVLVTANLESFLETEFVYSFLSTFSLKKIAEFLNLSDEFNIKLTPFHHLVWDLEPK